MKKLGKMRMVRAADAFLPLGLLIASLWRSDMAEDLFFMLLLTRLLSLATARGLRLAFSAQPSMRRARGSVKLALLLQPVGAAAVLLADYLRNGAMIPSHVSCAGTALLLNIEHVFYEYLCAGGDGRSAAMCRAITAALTAGGLLLTGVSSGAGLLPYGTEWLLGGAALSALVAAVIGLAVGGALKGKINAQALGFAPLSMLQSLIYPLCWLAATLIPASPLRQTRAAAPFFAGLTVYELCRAPFRRTRMESRALNRALLITAAAALAVLGLCQIPALQAALPCGDIIAAALAVLLGAACGFGMYGKAWGE